jgi:hypothetical protein
MLPSASSLGLAMDCPSSAVYPRVQEKIEVADKGTSVHRFLERVLGEGATKEAVLASIDPEHHQDCLDVDLDAIPTMGIHVKTEVTLAFNYVTGEARILGQNLGRNYGAAGLNPKEFCGTADRVGILQSGPHTGKFCVDDYKTGNAFTTPRPYRNWQLRLLAVCAWEIYPDAEELGLVVGIIKTKGEVRTDYLEVTPEMIAEWKAELMALGEEIHSGMQRTVLGEHCKYCPAFLNCPAQMAMIARLVKNPFAAANRITEELNDGDRTKAYKSYKMVKDAMKRLDGIFRMQAENTPIQLGDGRVYGPVQKTKTSIDGFVAYQKVKEKFGQAAAEASVTMDVSKASIQRAVKDLLPRGEKASGLEALMGVIAQDGGITATQRSEIREHRPGEETDEEV